MADMKDRFAEMSNDERLTYVIENLRCLPDDLIDDAFDLLIKADEIEYAVLLAREHGQIEKAISILVKAGDYLWASQIARSFGMSEEADILLHQGLEYYLAMEMYGRALSAAQALKLPADRIDAIFREGIAFESCNLDLSRGQAAMQSMISTLSGMNDEISTKLREAIIEEMSRHADGCCLKVEPNDLSRKDVGKDIEKESSDSDDKIEGGSFC